MPLEAFSSSGGVSLWLLLLFGGAADAVPHMYSNWFCTTVCLIVADKAVNKVNLTSIEAVVPESKTKTWYCGFYSKIPRPTG